MDVKQNLLLDHLDGNFPIMGYIIWWNSKNINIRLDELNEKLSQNGLDPKEAKQHNLRSSLIRSFREMEENRIIKLVYKDETRTIYQFTTEIKNELKEQFDYQLETKIKIDKTINSNQIEDIVSCDDPTILEKFISLYYQQRILFTSQDITRLIKRILNKQADIVLLREQGCIYFTPAAFRELLINLKSFMTSIESNLSFFPVPNLKTMQETIGNVVQDELTTIFETIQKEINNAKKEEKTEKWIIHRLEKINEINSRLEMYKQILNEKENDKLNNELQNIKNYLVGKARAINL